jgi:putative transposase
LIVRAVACFHEFPPCTLAFFRMLFSPRLKLVAENLALRQQLAVLNRTAKRPKLRSFDRLFWVTLSCLWKNWRSALIIVKPDTVIRWHREGFRLYWRWKSKARNSGRPKIDAEIRDLIRRMSEVNPLWGSPRIQAELNLLAFNVAESTVGKYRIKRRKPPSQTWMTFLSPSRRGTSAPAGIPLAVSAVSSCVHRVEPGRARTLGEE